MTRIDLFNTALLQTNRLRSQCPNDSAVLSVFKQLEYLIELEEGKRSDTERLCEIIIGVLTVREIEPLDMLVADLLYKVVEEVEQMKRHRNSPSP